MTNDIDKLTALNRDFIASVQNSDDVPSHSFWDAALVPHER